MEKNFIYKYSGNEIIDEFVKNIQRQATSKSNFIEWVEYNEFKNISFVAEGGFSTVYSATWNNGFIVDWNIVEPKRCGKIRVALKRLNNSKDITKEFSNEVIISIIRIYS